MPTKREIWEEQALSCVFKKVKITKNPLNPSLYDLSGERLEVITANHEERVLFLRQTDDKTKIPVDICDCDQA